MKDLRSVYMRYLPITFFGGLFVVILNIIVQLYVPTVKDHLRPWFYDALPDLVSYGTLWTAIGLATRQIKAAACALGVALLITAFNIYLYRGWPIITIRAISYFLNIFCNEVFMPGLVFLVICFKKQALRFIWPLCSLAFGFILLKAGSEYLAQAPYNAWFHALRIDELLKVNKTEHSFVHIDVFYLIFYLFEPCIMFLLIGEFYIAAAEHKKLQEGLTVNVATRITKTSAIVQFFTLRTVISLLVVGVISHPYIWLSRLQYRPDPLLPFFSFSLAIICALALLAVTTLYYRKFMVEYFISHNKKISWLFWLVNIPVIGMLVFPFVALATGPTSINHQVKPNMFILATLAVNLAFLFRVPHFSISGDVRWLVWILHTGIQLVILLPVLNMKQVITAKQDFIEETEVGIPTL